MSHTQGQNFNSDDHSAVVEWFIQYRKIVVAAIVIALIAIAFSVWWMNHQKRQEIQDYEQAEILAQELKSGEVTGQVAVLAETLNELKAIDDRYPALHRRYDGVLAQEFIVDTNIDSIDPYAKRSVTQLGETGLAHFATFSEVSRLAAIGELQKALDLAMQLKLQLQSEPLNPNRYALVALTVLDIVALNQRLGQKEGRDEAIQELSSLLGMSAELDASIQDAADAVRQLLQEKGSTLLEYLQKMQKVDQ